MSDLARLLVRQPPPGLRFGQGRVVSWDPSDFTHRIDWNGVILENIPVFSGVDALGFLPGTPIALLGYDASGGKGVTQWFVLGRLALPGIDTPNMVVRGSNLVVDGGQLIVVGAGGLQVNSGGDLEVNSGGDLEVNSGGDLNINDGGNLFVNDGGDVLVRDGGSIVIEDEGRWESHYGDGTVSAAMGPIWNPGLTAITDDGILVQDNNAGGNLDIFRALRDRTTGNKDIFVGQGSGNPVDEFSVNADILILNRTTGAGVVVSTDTTTDPANMRVVGNLQPMLRVTSAAKYKVDITDLVIDPQAVLKLRPRAWRDAGQVQQDPDMDRWTVGFVAEEVAEAGLTPFVDYDSDDNPESVAYDRLAVALLAVVQDQETRLQSLEARVAALDGEQAPRVAVQPTELPKRRFDPPVQMSQISQDRGR
jgi:hypothetical protein